jgi:hypothetical protein
MDRFAKIPAQPRALSVKAIEIVEDSHIDQNIYEFDQNVNVIIAQIPCWS